MYLALFDSLSRPPHNVTYHLCLCHYLPLFYPSLQSLAELSTLQGLEDDHTFQKEVSLKTLVYKAYRSDICGLKSLEDTLKNRHLFF